MDAHYAAWNYAIVSKLMIQVAGLYLTHESMNLIIP
jgi:hypothetical protein